MAKKKKEALPPEEAVQTAEIAEVLAEGAENGTDAGLPPEDGSPDGDAPPEDTAADLPPEGGEQTEPMEAMPPETENNEQEAPVKTDAEEPPAEVGALEPEAADPAEEAKAPDDNPEDIAAADSGPPTEEPALPEPAETEPEAEAEPETAALEDGGEETAGSEPMGPPPDADGKPEADDDTPLDDTAIPAEPPEEEPPPAKARPPRKKSFMALDLRDLDRGLSAEQRQEWESIYASYRSKSVLTGTAIGADQNSFEMRSRETGEIERKTLSSLIIIGYRVKVLIPETELWYPGEERPGHVLRNMVGSRIDYVIIEVDREGECAIGSRRMAQNSKRRHFAKMEHREGDLLPCRVVSVGAKRCTVECHGFDVPLTQRDLSYTAIPDLRAKYHPGQELTCIFKGYDRESGRLSVSVKEVNPNPFLGADRRHPVGSRRHAVISGKYAGGVFCTLPDETVCLCLYSPQHADADFKNGDSVILVIQKYDYGRQLIYGRILAKW